LTTACRGARIFYELCSKFISELAKICRQVSSFGRLFTTAIFSFYPMFLAQNLCVEFVGIPNFGSGNFRVYLVLNVSKLYLRLPAGSVAKTFIPVIICFFNSYFKRQTLG
jgi:hypothetical protein